MRICLINPSRVTPRAWRFPAVFQPLGIAYIAAVLERYYKTSIIDAPAERCRNLRPTGSKYYLGLSYEDIAQKIRRFSPDIVGITVPSTQVASVALEVANIVKSIDKDIITILGGPIQQ